MTREGFHPLRSIRAKAVWDHLCIDCAVDFPESRNGFKHMLIVVDTLSRYVVTKPLKSMSGESLARALYEVYALFGPPKSMQSDNGTEFINTILKLLCLARRRACSPTTVRNSLIRFNRIRRIY